jgi:hypothetical protein
MPSWHGLGQINIFYLHTTVHATTPGNTPIEAFLSEYVIIIVIYLLHFIMPIWTSEIHTPDYIL